MRDCWLASGCWVVLSLGRRDQTSFAEPRPIAHGQIRHASVIFIGAPRGRLVPYLELHLHVGTVTHR